VRGRARLCVDEEERDAEPVLGAALEAFAGAQLDVVVTIAGVDPEELSPLRNVRLERFLPTGRSSNTQRASSATTAWE
jgi:hypothetical protein